MIIRDLYLGKNPAGDRVWVNIMLERQAPLGRQRLSITGEVATKGHKRGGAGAQFGQLRTEDLPKTELAQRIGAIWNRWHLNDMHAGCEHQRAFGWTWDDHPNEPCPVCGYKYGSAWTYEPIPPEVVAEIESWAKVAV